MIWRHAGSSSSISSGMPQSSSTTCTSTPWDKPGRGGRTSRTTHPIRASTTATGPRHSGSTDNASTASRGRGAMSTLRMTRRHLLRAGFVAGATLSAGTVLPRPLRTQQPKPMLKEQMRTKDIEARRKLIFDIQRYAAEQQYYVYLYSAMFTGSWQSSVKNYAPNPSFDYGNRAAALWLDL